MGGERKWLFDKLSLRVNNGERIGIVGRNGAKVRGNMRDTRDTMDMFPRRSPSLCHFNAGSEEGRRVQGLASRRC